MNLVTQFTKKVPQKGTFRRKFTWKNPKIWYLERRSRSRDLREKRRLVVRQRTQTSGRLSKLVFTVTAAEEVSGRQGWESIILTIPDTQYQTSAMLP